MSVTSMMLPSGLRFDPLNLDPDSITVEDIARALSNSCRYGARAPEFYSVAQHSLHVAEVLESTGHQDKALAGLMHDASEAYLGDIPRPIKNLTQMKFYRSLDGKIMSLIAEKYNFTLDLPEVHEADQRMLMTEKERFWPNTDTLNWPDYEPYHRGTIYMMFTPQQAYERFIHKFRFLTA